MGSENPLSTFLWTNAATAMFAPAARQVEESEKQKKKDEAIAAASKAGAARLIQQREDQVKLADAQATQANLRAEQKAKPGGGRMSTILTSPIGYTGGTVLGGNKSAIGA